MGRISDSYIHDYRTCPVDVHARAHTQMDCPAGNTLCPLQLSSVRELTVQVISSVSYIPNDSS